MFIKKKSSPIYAFLEAQLSKELKLMLGDIYLLDSTTSTNDFLLDLTPTDLPNFSLCVSDTQTKGRGRLNRSWLSETYNGIYASIYWKPESLLKLQAFSLFIGTQIVSALNPKDALNMQLKWPNDIYLDQKKLAGILIETRPPNHVIIGFGLNIRSIELNNATCLMDAGFSNRSHVQVLATILNTLIPSITNFSRTGFLPYLPIYKSLDMLENKHITMSHAGQTCTGIARGINEDGVLILEQSDGSISNILNASNIRLTQEKC